MKEAAYILIGAGFTVVASYAAGGLLLDRLGLSFRRQERAPLAFLVGSALLSWFVFALCALHLAYKGTFLVLGLAPIAVRVWRRWEHPLPPAQAFAPLPRLWCLAAGPVVLLFSILYLSHAMAPEMSPDGNTYHLGLVYRYYREHGFPAITTNMYASLSQGAELLFLFAFAWGKHSAAAVTHLSFLFSLAWLMLCFGRRFGCTGAAAGAALLVFFSPVVAMDAASAYIDVAVAAVVFGLFYLLAVWDAERRQRLLVPIGVLAGFAFAMKYTAFLALPYAIGFVLWRLWPARRWRIRSAATIALVAAVWITPWLVKNAIVVGNPVSPFANRIFRNPYVHISFEAEYRHHMRNYDMPSRWEIPLEVTVRGNRLCGLLGPVFLLAPVALLAWREPRGRQFLLAALIFGSVYVTNIGTRFLIVALPFLALAMSLALTRMPALLTLLVVLHAAASWPDLLKKYCDPYAWRLDRINWRAALRIESQDGFLARKWPAYTVARMVDQLTPERAVIFTFAQMSEAYTRREVIVGFQSAEGAMLRDIFWNALFPDYAPIRHLNFNLPTAHRTRALRVIQTAANSPDHFSIHELRFFHQGRELARSPGWRLRAWPNTWDVQNAFDASPVTRWKSWERLWPGMFVEVDFGAEVVLDRVLVESSTDCGQSKMQLSLAPELKPVQIEAPPPLGLRGEAIREMKARGVTHLLVNDNDYGADDLASRQNDWGITLIGSQAGAKLYLIR